MISIVFIETHLNIFWIYKWIKSPNRWVTGRVWTTVFVFYCISFGLTCRWGREAMPSTGIKTEKQHCLHIQHLCPRSWISVRIIFIFIFFKHFVMPQWIKTQFTLERNNTQNIQVECITVRVCKILANVLSSASVTQTLAFLLLCQEMLGHFHILRI